MASATRMQGHTSNHKTGPWATALARRVHGAGAAHPTALDPLPMMVEALWSLFDAARTEANAALAQAGVPERIALEATPNERRYVLTEPSGLQRSLSITLTLAVIDRQPCGWASIRDSGSRAGIHLVPRVEQGNVSWQVAAPKARLTPVVVHDLFLSVFADDPAATLRLSPLGGSDLFQNPWN
ncbi:MAG TPA: hypothetical protein VN837_21200 [Chloroflexota bacterium]|nr:hypothetical protein [Chloroflexota bacterium]